ncbi:MAG: hypothetical protein EZS28_034768 [Streblomastix strix]|uniref:Cyclin N-terminal domain-containing protein n=1 Tax=Streblomastix strix TaxID=222440 RepID=A0A5J4UHT0_9EUKA|nr:MAG: hypothetical protein EZS28_034768 [Streblomastix strix]
MEVINKPVDPATDKNFESFCVLDDAWEARISIQLLNTLKCAVPDMEETVSLNSIELFLVFLQSKLEMRIGEGVYAVALLRKFVAKESTKGKRVLNKKNIGTVLVCLAMLTMKACRDTICKNTYWARSFKINSTVLNESELRFLKMVDFDMFMDEEEFWRIYLELMEMPIEDQGQQSQINQDT